MPSSFTDGGSVGEKSWLEPFGTSAVGVWLLSAEDDWGSMLVGPPPDEKCPATLPSALRAAEVAAMVVELGCSKLDGGSAADVTLAEETAAATAVAENGKCR